MLFYETIHVSQGLHLLSELPLVLFWRYTNAFPEYGDKIVVILKAAGLCYFTDTPCGMLPQEFFCLFNTQPSDMLRYADPIGAVGNLIQVGLSIGKLPAQGGDTEVSGEIV